MQDHVYSRHSTDPEERLELTLLEQDTGRWSGTTHSCDTTI